MHQGACQRDNSKITEPNVNNIKAKDEEAPITPPPLRGGGKTKGRRPAPAPDRLTRKSDGGRSCGFNCSQREHHDKGCGLRGGGNHHHRNLVDERHREWQAHQGAIRREQAVLVGQGRRGPQGNLWHALKRSFFFTSHRARACFFVDLAKLFNHSKAFVCVSLYRVYLWVERQSDLLIP